MFGKLALTAVTDASRFLAQSQSRLSNLGQPADENNDGSNRRPTEWPSRWTRSGRSFLQRGFGAGNPYQQGAGGGGSRFGHLNFASRYSTPAQDAPLFHSTRGDIHEEDEEEERDREAADLYALQRSRRVFAASRLEESSETDNDASNHSLGDSHERETRPFGDRTRGLGIRSSWNGTRSLYRRGPDQRPVMEDADDLARQDSNESDDAGKCKMVYIGLESTIPDDDPPADQTMETPVDPDPPAFQKFKSPANPSRFNNRWGSANDSELGLYRESSVDTNLQAESPPAPDDEVFKHDQFFAWLYLIALASMLATIVLVFLHTSAPSGKKPWGDTIYTTLLGSFHLLAVDTLVAVIVSLVWLAALRSFVRYLVGLIILAVPIILFSFSLYPLVSSYQQGSGSGWLQDLFMRWTSIIPAVSACLWLYLIWKGRSALRTAIEILEFSSRILAANSALVLVGMACLALVVLWTWAWLAMFTRVFLGGHFSSRSSLFVISASSWWLGVYFVLMYIWTLSIISGVQRGTTGATVSQWYFHRNAQPTPSSREVVAAALNHSLTTIFGTISLSTLLALVIRLPLLLLPQRFNSLLGLFFFSFIPPNIAAQTNPHPHTQSH